MLSPLFVASALLTFAHGAILNNYGELKDPSSYDFVVVGAGPGGSAVANRLTENPDFSVLVLEAGGANDGEITVDVPILCTRLTPKTQWDWNYTTTPQVNLNNRTLPFPRGIGLGGSSAVNCLVYTRGSKANIDQWATLAGDESWGWDALLPYFMKSEKFNFPIDEHDITDQFNPDVHGYDGFIGVSVPGAPRSIDDRILQTTQQSEEFPFQLDMNSGEHLGIGWVQALIDRGVRSSSKAYLTDDVLARDNLDILLNAHVARVVSEDGTIFNTVQFEDSEGQTQNITALNEVILSAGAVSSPVILMHSGIGSADELSAVGIQSLIDLPSVGKNLTDHIGVSSTFVVNNTKTWDTILRNETIFNNLMEQWQDNKTGIFGDTSENHAAFLRLPANSSILEQYPDPAADENTAHYEFLFQNGLYGGADDDRNYLNLPVGMVSPASRGAISINSSDPFAAPLIDPGLLTQEVDLAILREGIRAGFRFFDVAVWEGYVLETLNTATTDDELDTYIRENAVSFFHPVATAAMSPVNATWGVVDPDLKVKGVQGLRVVDASVAPSLPAAHTAAAVYAIAEKAADLIKAAYGA